MAFPQLMEAPSSTPILGGPNFLKTLIVDTDASSKGIGVFLMQDEHPSAFISKSLRPVRRSWQKFLVSEPDLLTLIFGVEVQITLDREKSSSA